MYKTKKECVRGCLPQEIGYEEGAASILVADIGEPPQVSEAHGQTKRGQKVLAMVAPFAALFPFIFFANTAVVTKIT
jgi:hypothetical protein